MLNRCCSSQRPPALNRKNCLALEDYTGRVGHRTRRGRGRCLHHGRRITGGAARSPACDAFRQRGIECALWILWIPHADGLGRLGKIGAELRDVDESDIDLNGGVGEVKADDKPVRESLTEAPSSAQNLLKELLGEHVKEVRAKQDAHRQPRPFWWE